jgi:peptidyl-prolyl cis-trans isomerase SurA
MSPFHKIKISAIFVVLVGVISLAAVRAEMVDRIVANVNGEIILYSDLQNQIKVLQRNMPSVDFDDPSKRPQIEREVLTQMVRQKLADAEAERLKVVVLQSELDQRMNQFIEINHITMEQLELNLKANGQTMEKFREEMRKEMERNALVERVLKSKVVISDQQVEAYLKGEKGESASTSQKIHLGLIASGRR